MKVHCRYKKPDGKKCRANATARSGFCFFHDPLRAVDRLEAQRTGGRRNKAASLPADTPDCDLKNVSDVATLLAATINQVRTGRIDPRIANAVGYLSATLLKALEVGGLEQRISDLEIATMNSLRSDSPFDREDFQFLGRPPDDQREASGAN
jgi:hypothetical protein